MMEKKRKEKKRNGYWTSIYLFAVPLIFDSRSEKAANVFRVWLFLIKKKTNLHRHAKSNTPTRHCNTLELIFHSLPISVSRNLVLLFYFSPFIFLSLSPSLPSLLSLSFSLTHIFSKPLFFLTTFLLCYLAWVSLVFVFLLRIHISSHS